MKTCDNCGKEKCDCAKYEDEIEQMKSSFVPMTYEEKMRRAEETVKRWAEQEKK